MSPHHIMMAISQLLQQEQDLQHQTLFLNNNLQMITFSELSLSNFAIIIAIMNQSLIKKCLLGALIPIVIMVPNSQSIREAHWMQSISTNKPQNPILTLQNCGMHLHRSCWLKSNHHMKLHPDGNLSSSIFPTLLIKEKNTLWLSAQQVKKKILFIILFEMKNIKKKMKNRIRLLPWHLFWISS